ncbi:MAG TPA: hypothetical protein VII22_27425 [Streptosporangiaceae bacterium]
MGKVIVIEHLTLDGVMQAPGHPEEDPRDGFQHGGWANRSQDPAMQEVMGAHMSSAWSLLAGRTTYERFADYWPKQEPNPITEALNSAQKYAASKSPVDVRLAKNHARVTSGPSITETACRTKGQTWRRFAKSLRGGPALAARFVDWLRGAKIHHLKELRSG